MTQFLRYREEFVAVCVAGAFWVWLALCDGDAIVDAGDRKELASIVSVLASLFGTALGFLLAVLALLFGTIDNDRYRLLRESKHYDELWRIFRNAIRTSAIALIISLLSLVWIWFQRPNALVLIAIAGFFVLVVLRVGKVIWVLENLMDIEIAKGRQGRDNRDV